MDGYRGGGLVVLVETAVRYDLRLWLCSAAGFLYFYRRTHDDGYKLNENESEGRRYREWNGILGVSFLWDGSHIVEKEGSGSDESNSRFKAEKLTEVAKTVADQLAVI